ncbi:solute carrier family 28 member 3-like [Physella acuta]|uniref:solute carrier family 28 member 3-like n=1 Tax=Physella acuta TaxID=109671 RepID=UPI0027DE8E12|nr:solute carrier family 28 member 3-like [Physella acuta]
MDHYFIFGALPIIFLTNATLTMLYYVGAMQFLIKCIGSFLRFVLKTSPVESYSVAAGIFLEGYVSILSLRPYLDRVSKSELFLIISSVFASLGGTYLAILSSLGVSLEFLIPAMVVSAPATFAVCKLMVPETRNMAETDKELEIGDEEKKKYTNIFDAAQTGATAMLAVIGNMLTVSFAFFSYIEWINNTLEWFGDRVGITKLSIELISSYLLYPVALAMGIEPEDCRNVAMLLGFRIGINNIIAFFRLTDLKINKAKYDNYMLSTNWTGTITRNRDEVILDMWNVTLKHGFISKRSEAIITYCLCGFSSCFTVAIIIGIMYTLLPQRKVWISKIALSALIAGNIANCMTGCFASIFY